MIVWWVLNDMLLIWRLRLAAISITELCFTASLNSLIIDISLTSLKLINTAKVRKGHVYPPVGEVTLNPENIENLYFSSSL